MWGEVLPVDCRNSSFSALSFQWAGDAPKLGNRPLDSVVLELGSSLTITRYAFATTSCWPSFDPLSVYLWTGVCRCAFLLWACVVLGCCSALAHSPGRTMSGPSSATSCGSGRSARRCCALPSCLDDAASRPRALRSARRARPASHGKHGGGLQSRNTLGYWDEE